MSIEQLSNEVLSFSDARRLATELSGGINVEANLRRLWFNEISVAAIKISGLEQALKKLEAADDIAFRRKAAMALMRFSNLREQAEEEEKEAQRSRKVGRPPKRKAEEDVKEKTITKDSKVAQKVKKRGSEAQKTGAAETKDDDKENIPMISAEELAKKLRDLPRRPTSLEALRFLRSLGPYSAQLLEDAEKLIGREMRRVDEVWRAMLFIKFGACKGNAKDVRMLFKELQEKKNGCH